MFVFSLPSLSAFATLIFTWMTYLSGPGKAGWTPGMPMVRQEWSGVNVISSVTLVVQNSLFLRYTHQCGYLCYECLFSTSKQAVRTISPAIMRENEKMFISVSTNQPGWIPDYLPYLQPRGTGVLETQGQQYHHLHHHSSVGPGSEKGVLWSNLLQLPRRPLMEDPVLRICILAITPQIDFP